MRAVAVCGAADGGQVAVSAATEALLDASSPPGIVLRAIGERELRQFGRPVQLYEAVAEVKLSPREADRCKNFFALGLVYWLYERPLDSTLRWIRDKFSKNCERRIRNGKKEKHGKHKHKGKGKRK